MAASKVRVLLSGAGAHGTGCYVNRLLPKLRAEGAIECAGIVEPSTERRAAALATLGLPGECGFSDLDGALKRIEADAVIIASPFACHEADCLRAAGAGLHLFIEKPLAGSLSACCRVERAVGEYGVKAAVNMSARFEPEKQAFARALADGAAGRVEYLFARLAWDHTAAARGRAEGLHPYLLEGGVHVLDMLRVYAGGLPARVYNMAWRSPHSVFSGLASNLVSFEMDNGVCCALEGSWTVQAGISTWRDEYIRADGSTGALLLDQCKLSTLRGRRDSPEGLITTPLEYPENKDNADGTEYLFRQFLDWTCGRREDHPTNVSDNLQCMALLYAANASAESKQAVDIQHLLTECRAS